MAARCDSVTPIERRLLADLGKRMRAARESSGMTVADLAAQVGIARATLTSVERGDGSPKISTYLRVMKSLGLIGDFALIGGGDPTTGPGFREQLTGAETFGALNSRSKGPSPAVPDISLAEMSR